MTPIRRRTLAAGAAAVLATPRIAKAAPEFEWRLGHTAPDTFPLHRRLVEAVTEIETKSEGRIKITVHPDSQLGGQLGLLQQGRGGNVQIAPVTGVSLYGVLSTMYVQAVGFAFPGYDRLWPAMDGDVGKLLRSQMRERLGVMAMARCWDFGFRQITTRDRPVKTPADLKGLKIRVPVDPDLTALFQALHATPLGMDLQNLLPAMSAGDVDAQEGVLPFVQATGLFRLQSFCALTDHTWDGQWICINNRAWARLPDNLKTIVAEAFDAAALRQRTDTATTETTIRTDLTKYGMTFNTIDPAPFRSTLRQAGYYEKAQQRTGDDLWAALEKYVGPLA
jgi:TRAP-type transport system periplasmic protein